MFKILEERRNCALGLVLIFAKQPCNVIKLYKPQFIHLIGVILMPASYR